VAARGVGAAVIAMGVVVALAGTAGANHSIVEHLSIGSTGGNAAQKATFDHVSVDGSRVLFHTIEPLVAEDTDSAFDIYERADGITTLITPAPIDGIVPNSQMTYQGASDDGSRVFFGTPQRLVPEDVDGGGFDLYEVSAGTVSLVSTGPVGAADTRLPRFVGAAPDGTTVYFKTRAQLAPEDNDGGMMDVYERSGGTTTLASTGPFAGGTASDVDQTEVSRDGGTVYFTTTEQLVPEDLDNTYDLYAHSAGVTTLLSKGEINGNGPYEVDITPFTPAYTAPDHVLFWTEEQLVPEDSNALYDLYERAGDSTVLISASESGSAGGISWAFSPSTPSSFAIIPVQSNDGTHAIFASQAQLTSADLDGGYDDVYERFAGQVRLVSTGPASENGHKSSPQFFKSFGLAVSPDGSRIFWETNEKLTADDRFDGCNDGCTDIYERSGGTTTLITGGPQETIASTEVPGQSSIRLAAPGGGRVIFETLQNLVSSDTDGLFDAYEFDRGELSLLTPGPGASQAAGASADGSRVVVATPDPLLSSDTDAKQDLYRLTVAPDAYPSPKGATPIHIELVPAYQPCTSPNRVHAPPLAFGSCNPPAMLSPNVTIGTPDANDQPAKGVADVKLKAVSGDVQIDADVSDVRKIFDLSDYTGELQLVMALRVTDRNSLDPDGGSPNATMVDIPFPVTLTCTATPDTTVGSRCTVATSLVAIGSPNAIVAGKRTVAELGQVKLYDGGPDDSAGTADNSLFMTQGLFTP
jgi:hypothetical protein